jgi:hypothetical protein
MLTWDFLPEVPDLFVKGLCLQAPEEQISNIALSKLAPGDVSIHANT